MYLKTYGWVGWSMKSLVHPPRYRDVFLQLPNGRLLRQRIVENGLSNATSLWLKIHLRTMGWKKVFLIFQIIYNHTLLPYNEPHFSMNNQYVDREREREHYMIQYVLNIQRRPTMWDSSNSDHSNIWLTLRTLNLAHSPGVLKPTGTMLPTN